MDYRTILVHLDAGPAARCRLDVGVRLAAAHGARLVGLYSAVMIERHSFYGADAGHMLERQQQLDSSRDEVARHFASATASAGVEAECDVQYEAGDRLPTSRERARHARRTHGADPASGLSAIVRDTGP